MFLSILFGICFIFLFLAVMMFPKMEGKLNAIKMGVMAVISIFCYLSMTAFVFDKIGIPINLKSDIASMMVANIILWTGIIRKKKVQRMFVRVWDVVCLLVLAVFVLYLSYNMFGASLRLSYANTDPANHFHYAMNIITTERLNSGIYFSAYIDAIFIQLASFALKQVTYYKAFIIADIFMHVMEIWMFYVLVLTISEKKIVRVLAPVFSVMYFWGYPAHSYLEGGFVYWSNGVMILIFMIYALVLLERYLDRKVRTTAVLLLLGMYANSCCNRLFVPLNMLAIVVALAVVLWKRKAHASRKTIAVIVVALAVCVFAFTVIFMTFWGGYGLISIIEKMIAYVSTPHGGFYRAMYADNIFFIPPFVFAMYYVWRERERYTPIYVVITACMVVCTAVMFAVWYQGLMSTYYFYKIYYNLWLMGMILVVFALDIMADKDQLSAFYAYASMIVLMVVISLTCYDDKNTERDPYYDSYYATEKVMPLYRYNLDYLRKDFEAFRISDGLLSAMEYVLTDEEYGRIPITADNIGVVRWYEGITVQSMHDSIDSLELPEIVEYLDANQIKKITVSKTDPMYEEYTEFYMSCDVVYENSEAAVLSNGGRSWSMLLQQSINGLEE